VEIVSICVGETFCKKYSQKVKDTAPKNIDLIILTDFPQYFSFCKTELFSDKVFSYFLKNTFSVKNCKKFKSDILYIDIDSFHLINKSFYDNQNNYNSFLYDKLWPDYPYSEIDSLPSDLIKYYKISGNLKIENIHEKIFYIPYSNKIENLYKDLNVIKEIWDRETKVTKPKGNAKRYSKYGVGYGEGIPLSLALFMNGIITKQFDFKKTEII